MRTGVVAVCSSRSETLPNGSLGTSCALPEPRMIIRTSNSSATPAMVRAMWPTGVLRMSACAVDARPGKAVHYLGDDFLALAVAAVDLDPPEPADGELVYVQHDDPVAGSGREITRHVGGRGRVAGRIDG